MLDYSQPAAVVAPQLLGAVLTSKSADGVVSVRISEVEAYGGAGEDPASHAFRGLTPRTEVMFGPPGHFYVYFTYGTHWCANVVTQVDGVAGAVLLRAGEVVAGIDVARGRRPAAKRDRDLARGPARLTQALGVTGAHNGLVVTSGALTLDPAPCAELLVAVGPRIGITTAVDVPWRFWIEGDSTVSAYRPGRSRRR